MIGLPGVPGVAATTHMAGMSRVGVGGMGGRVGAMNVVEVGVAKVDAEVVVPDDDTDTERVEREESDLNMVAGLCRYSNMLGCARIFLIHLMLLIVSIVNKSLDEEDLSWDKGGEEGGNLLMRVENASLVRRCCVKIRTMKPTCDGHERGIRRVMAMFDVRSYQKGGIAYRIRN
jgi:hypothetical protein